MWGEWRWKGPHWSFSLWTVQKQRITHRHSSHLTLSTGELRHIRETQYASCLSLTPLSPLCLAQRSFLALIGFMGCKQIRPLSFQVLHEPVSPELFCMSWLQFASWGLDSKMFFMEMLSHHSDYCSPVISLLSLCFFHTYTFILCKATWCFGVFVQKGY